MIVLRPHTLLSMFDPLAAYDLAGVMEGYSRGWSGDDTSRRDDRLAAPPDTAGRGWEVNTGALAVRRQAEWLVRAWADEYSRNLSLYARLSGVDQVRVTPRPAAPGHARLSRPAPVGPPRGRPMVSPPFGSRRSC